MFIDLKRFSFIKQEEILRKIFTFAMHATFNVMTPIYAPI